MQPAEAAVEVSMSIENVSVLTVPTVTKLGP